MWNGGGGGGVSANPPSLLRVNFKPLVCAQLRSISVSLFTISAELARVFSEMLSNFAFTDSDCNSDLNLNWDAEFQMSFRGISCRLSVASFLLSFISLFRDKVYFSA